MKNTVIIPFEKKKFDNKRKLGVVFDRTMSNIYENNIFPTLLCAVVKIDDIKH